jgi:glycerol kinase
MTTKKYVLAIDQGTSATKSLIFDEAGLAVAFGVEPLDTSYFNNGFVEQEPEEIYKSVIASVKKCFSDFTKNGFNVNDIVSIGISNQRETFLLWDKNGKPLCNAIVWQCKRSSQICESLKKQKLEQLIKQKTGLFIDPYFSATKLIWLFQNDEKVKEAIQNGDAFFGTIDTWLLYKLTNGTVYATDFTNASRTMFFNLNTLKWDEELIKIFELTGINLPEIKPSSAMFGVTNINNLLNNDIPITALIGDSHAAAFGEGCFEKGTAKATMGTGCSILMNIGEKPVFSDNGMVTTICWSTENRIDYALEGVIVSCGSTIEWLKNELNLFVDINDTATMANLVADNAGVYLVPAFCGLGSPHWDMDRKASLTGMSFATTKNHLVRAALESIPYQIKDVIDAMEKDAIIPLTSLMADGGLSANLFVMDFLADLLKKNVVTIGTAYLSSLGAAYLSGLKSGVFESIESLKLLNTDKNYFKPNINNDLVVKGYEGWLNAIINISQI